MRLQSIKLSGFKSFVEPTNFELPGQLVGVVGPNGCGKSNIMDAVRWVLGESKASELRGESMQDVIFNGTNLRKPASRASVELVFDNDDHRAGGQWAQYAQISVRRVLTRDGNSSYFINNQSVRRRDVHDVFLGTGLGPRAYAIIGQGTISRIIESRPEELRLFLEEAAGVSKYKERRRETANRLSDTRENLTRVEDILRELNSNLSKLERQAEVAEKFKTLQAQATLKQQQIWMLKRNEAQVEQVKVKAEVESAITALEGRMAELRQVEADLEAIRQSHYAAGDAVNQAQGALYEATAEVGKLEAEIRFVVEGRRRLEARLEQINEQLQQWQHNSQQASDELAGLATSDEEAAVQAEILAAQLEEQQLALPQLEDKLRAEQQSASEQRNLVNQVQQQIQVLAAEQRAMSEQERQLSARHDKLSADKAALSTPDTERLEHLQSQSQAQMQAFEALQAQFEELQADVPQLDEARAQAQAQVTAESHKQADLRARIEALTALQAKLQANDQLAPWLAKHGLDHLQPLWKSLHIESGWEMALESALRERMAAVGVGRLDMVSGFAADAPATKLTFYATSTVPAASAQGSLKTLSSLLRVHDSGLMGVLNDWLQGTFVANSLDDAMRLRDQLNVGQRIVVQSGHVVTPTSVGFYAQDDEQSGMFARAQEIENLDKHIKAQDLIVQQAKATAVKAESAYAEASQQLHALRAQVTHAQSAAHQAQVQFIELKQQVEQTQARSAQLGDDLGEIVAAQEALRERSFEAEARFEQLDMQLADTQERHAQLDERVMEAERQLNHAREQLRTLERQAQEAVFSQRTMQARQAELQRVIDTAAQQSESLQQEQVRVAQELQQLSDAAAQGGLQDALARKLDKEQALAAQRSAYEDLSAKLRASDERRLQVERALEPQRQQITEMRLKEQAAALAVEQFQQALADVDADLDAVAASIEADGVKLWGLQGEVDRLNREIQSLGAVNLAALDELSEARERKMFLDAQSADLNDAINTLEDAIQKIDMETRDLLQGTFDTVNEHFGRMFPDLFGGGNAKLVMTGEEILDAGVQVMAQPPGKKNQTIHLLSGGEKALTAIALVFAIFQLNPAPFCLLDEVDAPLDDANTERYAKLVARMSQDTQFLFISHNKIAMEMAQQLIGVTMQEQGVSRIVAVDMDVAVNMAESE
ncbi:MAG: chromosome segregation protein [Pseudomonadota bacterium]